jgi:hypothetical protein
MQGAEENRPGVLASRNSVEPYEKAAYTRCRHSHLLAEDKYPLPDAMRKIALELSIVGLSLMALAAAAMAEDTVEVAVSGRRVSSDYVRTKLADGSFEPEPYMFGQGGYWSGAMRDESIDKLKFMDVARCIAIPLEAQNYLPAKDPKKIRLLIVVYWGTTTGTDDTSASAAYQNFFASQLPSGTGQTFSEGALDLVLLDNAMRDQANLQNARMLGYDSTGMIGTGLGMTAMRGRELDLIAEIEENRYFVVLMAYDFQLMWKENKSKLLWETRYSIRQRRNEFDKQLMAMTASASRYFGQDSHGLIRKEIPKGKVTIGDLKVLGVSSDSK